jgi:hypothetical protein
VENSLSLPRKVLHTKGFRLNGHFYIILPATLIAGPKEVDGVVMPRANELGGVFHGGPERGFGDAGKTECPHRRILLGLLNARMPSWPTSSAWLYWLEAVEQVWKGLHEQTYAVKAPSVLVSFSGVDSCDTSITKTEVRNTV